MNIRGSAMLPRRMGGFTHTKHQQRCRLQKLCMGLTSQLSRQLLAAWLLCLCMDATATPAASLALDVALPACSVNIWTPPLASTVPVPPSFLGLSHEPLTAAAPMLNNANYRGMLKLLSSFETGPLVIRWGGSTQDYLNQTLGQEHWRAMKEVHLMTGAKFAIGLNLLARNPELAASQVRAALEVLPPEAVLSFAVGNEPDFYHQLHSFPVDYWAKTWFEDQASYAKAMEPLLRSHFNHTNLISGPGVAWDKQKMFGKPQAVQLVSSAPLEHTTSYLTAHWYAGRATHAHADVSTFLADSKMTVLTSLARTWVNWAKDLGVTFRLEEFNSLCEGGLHGASDTLGAALFVIESALNMVKAGVSGMNWHGTACYAYSPVLFPSLCDVEQIKLKAATPNRGGASACRATCGKADAPPVVSAPYYGLLFTQMALRGLPDMVTTPSDRCDNTKKPSVKVHTFSARNGREVRVVMVKKEGAPEHFNLTIKGSAYSTGSITLLTGPNLRSSAPDMTIGGQQVSAQGSLAGDRHAFTVRATHTRDCQQDHGVEICAWLSHYSVPLPAVGAALMVVERLEFM